MHRQNAQILIEKSLVQKNQDSPISLKNKELKVKVSVRYLLFLRLNLNKFPSLKLYNKEDTYLNNYNFN